MKGYFVCCPYCNEEQEVIRYDYEETLTQISEWLITENDNEAAKDAMSDIVKYKDSKLEYIKQECEFSPVFCKKCSEHFFFDHIDNKIWKEFGGSNHKDKQYEIIPKALSRMLSEVLEENKNKQDIKKGYIYFIRDLKTGYIKIGCSKNPSKRIKSLSSCSISALEMVKVIEAGDEKTMFCKEKELHERFSNYKVRGEWFDIPFVDFNILGMSYQERKERLVKIYQKKLEA